MRARLRAVTKRAPNYLFENIIIFVEFDGWKFYKCQAYLRCIPREASFKNGKLFIKKTFDLHLQFGISICTKTDCGYAKVHYTQ